MRLESKTSSPSRQGSFSPVSSTPSPERAAKPSHATHLFKGSEWIDTKDLVSELGQHRATFYRRTRKQLLAAGVPSFRQGPRSPIRWHYPSVIATLTSTGGGK